jgi:hypothetical protein
MFTKEATSTWVVNSPEIARVCKFYTIFVTEVTPSNYAIKKVKAMPLF